MMNSSKRLALLGAQSAFSVAKPRGLGSSIGFIDRRPFLYRQISELTTKANVKGASLVDKLARGMDAEKAEALAGVITHSIELAKENVRRHCEESHKLREELDKYQSMVDAMLAEQRCENAIAMNKIEKDLIKSESDLRKEFVQLRVEYEAGRLQAVKYAMGTLAAIGFGFSWFRMMK